MTAYDSVMFEGEFLWGILRLFVAYAFLGNDFENVTFYLKCFLGDMLQCTFGGTHNGISLRNVTA